ncbi:IS630 family transposase [Bradyrhizobium sp. CB3481]|uniref:IS630 family transposase n=1 Tax=Bradyrhizobium sp. CB3481 TaxID=3039158 RepID=UPI0024B1B042|nr:IS630 family transposase [Bradyrhizobium sp. CB3481]WFU14658.1 IS630 family transposase [Bradyrhizobium sp. CB3481]
MGKPYSLDLRKRVVAAIESGMSRNQAAKQFGVAISTAIGWMKRVDETGSVEPGQIGGYKPKAISGEHAVWLSQRIKDGDFTIRGLVAELAGRGLKVDYHSVWDFVHAAKLSFKKKRVAAGERDRPEVARRRAQWAKYQGRVEAERLVFIDETWTRTDMAPLRGWAPRGHRLHAKVPHGRWKTMTFLAALRHDRIDAPWFIEGPIDGVSFRTYIEKVLLPTLQPGDIVVLDNLGSHRSKSVRQLIRSVGAKLFFLPKYSPDLNPIEQVFAKLKHLVRKAAARTVEAVCTAVGHALDAFTSEECANYLKNSGYRT